VPAGGGERSGGRQDTRARDLPSRNRFPQRDRQPPGVPEIADSCHAGGQHLACMASHPQDQLSLAALDGGQRITVRVEREMDVPVNESWY
jgi:hypothetical protein